MTYPYPPQQRAPKKKSHLWPILVGVAVVLIVGCGIIAYAISKAGMDVAQKTANNAASAGDQNAGGAPEEKPPGTIGGGRLEVGTDIQPGTYKATVPKDSVGCYWARLKNLEGGGDSILANNIHQPGDKVTVTILAGDKGFESQGCGDWTKS